MTVKQKKKPSIVGWEYGIESGHHLESRIAVLRPTKYEDLFHSHYSKMGYMTVMYLLGTGKLKTSPI
ncbi:uncharacterized protein [Rhodnius prolixus]|uniref:uncharacterized protein n=1 Tax=Rhodnius prolixus TaxID=13249 RepID=UPI003D1895EF